MVHHPHRVVAGLLGRRGPLEYPLEEGGRAVARSEVGDLQSEAHAPNLTANCNPAGVATCRSPSGPTAQPGQGDVALGGLEGPQGRQARRRGPEGVRHEKARDGRQQDGHGVGIDAPRRRMASQQFFGGGPPSSTTEGAQARGRRPHSPRRRGASRRRRRRRRTRARCRSARRRGPTLSRHTRPATPTRARPNGRDGTAPRDRVRRAPPPWPTRTRRRKRRARYRPGRPTRARARA